MTGEPASAVATAAVAGPLRADANDTPIHPGSTECMLVI